MGASVGRVRRIEHHAEEAALASGDDATRYVEKRRGEQRATLHDADASRLFHYEEARIAARRREVHRAREAFDDLLRAQGHFARSIGRCGWTVIAARPANAE